MLAWSVPQYWLQNRWYVPGTVAVNHSHAVRLPGITSRLTRKAGTKKSWITSSLVITSSVGWPTGTCSVLISRTPSSCWIFHIHCLPTTYTRWAWAGGCFICTYRPAPRKNMVVNSTNVAPVHTELEPVVRARSAAGLSSGDRRR